FAADRAYLPHMATALASLLVNNAGLAFHFHILHTDIDGEALARLTAGVPHPVTSQHLPDSAFAALPVVGHLARSAYYRLFAADVIDAPQALYLDSDLIVLGDLAPLLATDLGSHAIGAVENPGAAPHPGLRMRPDSGYFNSGVMLLGLDAWRARSLRHTVIERIRAAPHAIRFADQCGLNAVLDGDWLRLHPRHNVISNFWQPDQSDAIATFGAEAVAEAVRDPLIVHFTGSSKPWQLNDHHPMKQRYWQYRNQTAFRSRLADDFSIKTLVRRLLPAPVERLFRQLRGR
ncbi:glycosyltransferase family 8 protein, partial [Polymorphobacter multimanifer]|uniref:glycosyltransferase family 8 protein n=1 Tax=Polymorphobacter multimanifer TaxID=1070431 RepID=UPI001666596F